MGFPGSSACKEFACNAGDPSSIPGLGSSPGEGMGYLLQYSWAFLVAQTGKNLPAMQGTWVQSLGWKDPLEESMATLKCEEFLGEQREHSIRDTKNTVHRFRDPRLHGEW